MKPWCMCATSTSTTWRTGCSSTRSRRDVRRSRLKPRSSKERVGLQASSREPAGARTGDQSRQSFLASMGQMFRRLLELHNLDAAGIARHAGIDIAAMPTPGERIEVDKIDAMLRVAIPLVSNPAFGLQA